MEDRPLGIAVRLGGRGEREARRGRERELGSDIRRYHEGSCEYVEWEGEKGDETDGSSEAVVATTGHSVVESTRLGVAPRLKLNIHRTRGYLGGINRLLYPSVRALHAETVTDTEGREREKAGLEFDYGGHRHVRVLELVRAAINNVQLPS